MKNLYLIGGTMGVGKTTVCNKLKEELENSVFFDGDWAWNSNPWLDNEETRAMAIDNIHHLLVNFLKCSAYDNVIVCWVMHEQRIIDKILEGIDTSAYNIRLISLICNEANLIARLRSDVINNIRKSNEIIYTSLKRLPLYNSLNTVKIDTSNKSIKQIVNEIMKA